MDTDKKYYAFISYKREDEKQAEWLQDKLEHYRFPTNLNGRTDLPKSVRPTFRDVTDLAPGLLAEEINQALEESQWLVVVCSPRSAKSPWVCKEAQTFIDSGRADRIIPYVIEGVPFSGDEATECYPDALLKLTGSRELLAANVDEMGRDAALIKVLARMFNLRFDTLWQRHTREQRKKRILWGSVAAFVVVLSVLVSGWFYRANNEISRQNEVILNSRDKLLVSQSQYLVSEAQKEYDKGNITKALRMALYALPKDLDNPDRPYVHEAEEMLRSCDFSNDKNLCGKTIINFDKNVIRSIDLSLDENFILIVLSDGTTRVYDALTGKPITNPLKHRTQVFSAIFSPDGKSFVAISKDNTCRIFDSQTNKSLTQTIRHNDKINSAFFSSNGKSIITASDDKTVCVWDINKNGQLKRVLQHNDKVKSASFSPDEKYIVTASSDNTSSVWNTETGKLILKLRHNNKPDSIIFGLDNGNSSLIKADEEVVAMFSPNGKYILTASVDDYIRIWDVRTGKSIMEPLQYNGDFKSIAFSPNSKFILMANGCTISVWEITTSDVAIKPLKHNAPVTSAAFTHDGKYILSTSRDGGIYIWELLWDAKTGIATEHFESSFRFGSYSRVICSLNRKNFLITTSNTIYVRNLLNATDFANGSVKNFSPDGKYIVTASDDNTACVWDAMTGKALSKPLQHNSLVLSAVFSPNSKYIVTTASYDKTAHIWDAKTSNPVAEPLQHNNSVNSAAFSPDGKYVVTASDDHTARVWDAKTGEPVTEPLQHSADVQSAVYSPDGEYIVTASYDGTARIWDTATGKPITNPLRHNNSVLSAVFSPDGKYVLTTALHDAMNIWNAKNGIRFKIERMQYYSLSYSNAIFSPNNKNIVISLDGALNNILPFPPLQELIDKYRNDPEHDWSLSEEEKEEYSLE